MRALQAAERIPELCGDTPQLPLSPFAQHDAQRSLLTRLAQDLHGARSRFHAAWPAARMTFFEKPDASAPFNQLFRARLAIDDELVGFRVAETRVGEFLRECAVVRKDDEALARRIEAADCVKVTGEGEHLAQYRPLIARVSGIGGEDVARLVDSDIEVGGGRGDGATIEGDAIVLWIGALPELCDTAIDADAPLSDERFAGAAGTNICLSEDFLEALGVHV